MYHGCRRLVCSLACVFSILFMLFLDTCIASAAGSAILGSVVSANSHVSVGTTYFAFTPTNSYETNVTFTFTGTNSIPNTFTRGSDAGSFTYSGSSTSAGMTYGNGTTSQTVNLMTTEHNESLTGTITQSNSNVYSGTYHVKIPCWLPFNEPSQSLDLERYYAFRGYINFNNPTSGQGDAIAVSNPSVYSWDGDLIAQMHQGTWTNGNVYVKRGIDFVNGSWDTSQSNYGLLVTLEYDLAFSGSTGGINTFTQTIEWSGNLYNIKDEYQSSLGEGTVDTGTHEKLDSLNETEQDTNTKITDFFGSFFDNLLHIFVPEDGYFSTWFDKVNTLLSEKLGMLYAPFDLVISTLQAIYSADSTETGIPFPGIKWEDTWLVEPFTFTFASLGSDFDDLRDKVYFATDTVLVLTFLMLLQSKVKLILEGHE